MSENRLEIQREWPTLSVGRQKCHEEMMLLWAPELTKDMPSVSQAIEQAYEIAKDQPELAAFARIVDQRRGSTTPHTLPADAKLSPLAEAQDALFESIRLIQLGQRSKALLEYDRSQELITSTRSKVLGDQWVHDAICGILVREVEERLKK